MPSQYKAACLRMDSNTPGTARCRWSTPATAYRVSGTLAGAYAITLDTGITGTEVSACELDSSEERGNPTSANHVSLVRTTKEFLEKIKELDSAGKVGKAVSKYGDYFVDLSQRVSEQITRDLQGKPLEQISRNLGRDAAAKVEKTLTTRRAGQDQYASSLRSA
jgi:hypothetical protein